MPSLQSLRRKIASVKNTQKITKAMKVEFLEYQSKLGHKVSVSLVGRKSIDFFRRRNWTVRQQWGSV